MDTMFDNYGVNLTRERYEELIRAEHERDALFRLLNNRYADYGRLDREHIVLLRDLFAIKEEQNEEL